MYKVHIVSTVPSVGELGVHLTSVLYTVIGQNKVTPDMELEPDNKAVKTETGKQKVQGKPYHSTDYRIQTLHSLTVAHTKELKVSDRQNIESILTQTIANYSLG